MQELLYAENEHLPGSFSHLGAVRDTLILTVNEFFPSPRTGRVQSALVTLPLVALLCAAPSFAQKEQGSSTQQEKQNLPSAPSALLLSQQDEKLGRAAGSGFTFKPPSTAPGPGGVTIEQPSDTPLRVSIDDAVSLGLQRNVRLIYDRAKQKTVRGEQLGVINALLPSLHVSGSTATQEINLAALGFKPSEVAAFGLNPADFPFIVKVNVTQAQVSASKQAEHQALGLLWLAAVLGNQSNYTIGHAVGPRVSGELLSYGIVGLLLDTGVHSLEKAKALRWAEER